MTHGVTRLDLSNSESVELFKALGSQARLDILRLLSQRDCNVTEIVAATGMSQPTVTRHIQALESVGLVKSEYGSGMQGLQKRCFLATSLVEFELVDLAAALRPVEVVSMPIGLYTLALPGGTCGLASRTKFIGFLDSPQAFFDPERASAQILWMSTGFVEYSFPNDLPGNTINRIELVAEVCSEAPNYNMDWPSDITVWINNIEVGTWTSPSDFGGVHGALNPDWWVDHMTQHGALKVWSVDERGSYVDGNPVSDTTISRLLLSPKHPITVRIGVKPDAENQGGFNLFGSGFGHYPQDLVLRMHYSPKVNSSDEYLAVTREKHPPLIS